MRRRNNPKLGTVTVPGWLVAYIKANRDFLSASGIDLSRAPFGCGHYGCAFHHRLDERFVVKISRDPAEGPAARLMKRLQAEGAYGVDGCVKFQSITKGPEISFKGKSWPTHVIVRENVNPLGGEWGAESAPIGRLLSDAQQAARDYQRRASLKRPSANAMDASQQQYMSRAGQLSRWAPYLSEFMMAAVDYFGAPLTDVHYNNVGRTITDWGRDERPPGTIVAFDLGHTAPVSE